jgi:hypothetical protein
MQRKLFSKNTKHATTSSMFTQGDQEENKSQYQALQMIDFIAKRDATGKQIFR